MYKLLIVDDEQLIVDWLYRLFGGLTHLDLDLYKAYTGEQAMSWLNRTKIDIVLTDIHMPEMNGMELLEQIKDRWPECKVIFLTGYNQFEYVYSAIKHDGVSYLLKTEGDAEIVAAVEKAVGDIERSFKNTELLGKVKAQIGKALPLLQREYLTNLLRGEQALYPVTQRQLDEVEIPLQAELPVFILLGRMDNVSKRPVQSDKNRMIYAVKNVIEQYWFGKIRSAFLVYEEAYSVWLFQPVAPDLDWHRAGLFVRGMLENAQRACMESLQVGMSFALAKEEGGWETVSDAYYRLKQLLGYRVGTQSGIIVTESEAVAKEQDEDAGKSRGQEQIHAQLNRIGKLESCLERGQKQEFFELFSEIADYLLGAPSMRHIPALEVYYSLSLKLMSYMNRWGLADTPACRDGIGTLTNIERFDGWAHAVEYLRRMAVDLFELQATQQEKRERDTIMLVQRYIMEHLSEDISLVKLGELACFNPSYLSRLFKQITGTNISDLIQHARINKAKELLGGTAMKIHEVAAAVGFDSPAYFAKFFKKSTQMTPQEYRDSMIKR